jgi:hypothetical protein
MNIKNGEDLVKSLILAYETSRLENKNFYLTDEIMAQKALGVFIGYIQDILLECPNVEYKQCSTWWRHEECDKLMNILYALTGDIKYKAEYPKQDSLWD